tara:strand:+ start:164 stop:400 length:237 start_codon:yes stop_codon:yes gene_type:complete
MSKKQTSKKDTVAAPKALLVEAKKQMANEDISKCEAIRNVAKKFRNLPRSMIVETLTGPAFKINKGTVNTQIQLSRSM